jgi:hypothetical protein
MNVKRIGLLIGVLALVAIGTAFGETPRRSGYSYIRELSGDVTVESRWNGQVEGRRNMPISAGDELSTGERGRAEVALADGSVLHVGGAAQVLFVRLRAQQGEEDDFSGVDLKSGSVVLASSASDDAVPRIDTDDATVYLSAGSRARVNVDSRRGTVVIARAGSAEVRTRAGTTTVRAGSYLEVNGDQEPEVARGSFSRDRFDIWSADRFDMAAEAHSASSRYVDEDYGSDVVALDAYGDWNYNNTYSSYVWSPRVAAGWAPYSSGSWYYTPSGLTWWSYDPWGWFPHHYGNWFWDTGWNRWCWSPASVYSPAWVYWGFTSSYVGWCPIGWYSFYSPWWDTYYKRWNGVGRGGVYFSVHGTFSTRTVDMRGWNFAGAGAVGAAGRMDVIPGSRIGDRLGPTVAISSRTVVVNAREGGGRDAVQGFVREAPRVIDRTANSDSGRMAPVLGRQRELPAASADALRDRLVVPSRGRLEGPGVDDLAPRGALVDRTRVIGDTRGRGREPAALDRGRPVSEPAARPSSRPGSNDDFRSRTVDTARPRADRGGAGEDWRDRGRTAAPDQVLAPSVSDSRAPAARSKRPEKDWRARSGDLPPARRVIEGAVPGRRRDSRGDDSVAPRESVAPRDYRRGRDSEPQNPVRRERIESAPQRYEPRSAPPPRIEQRSAPAPAPRSAPAPAPHSAPAPAAPHKEKG